ncbi:MAG: hypothetical protein N2C12_11410 [Planctomycetales bacterium]
MAETFLGVIQGIGSMNIGAGLLMMLMSLVNFVAALYYSGFGALFGLLTFVAAVDGGGAQKPADNVWNHYHLRDRNGSGFDFANHCRYYVAC